MRRLTGYPTKKKKIETSKILAIIAVILSVIVTLATIVAVFVLENITPLEILIPSIFGLNSTTFGFYFWKAKNENIKKYGNNVEEEQC